MSYGGYGGYGSYSQPEYFSQGEPFDWQRFLEQYMGMGGYGFGPIFGQVRPRRRNVFDTDAGLLGINQQLNNPAMFRGPMFGASFQTYLPSAAPPPPPPPPPTIAPPASRARRFGSLFGGGFV